MSKALRVVFAVVVLGCISGLFLQRQRSTARLEAELARLHEQATRFDALREENARLAKAQIDPSELERLRAGQSELLRLRNEVTQLRRQIAETSARRAVLAKEAPPVAAAEETRPPVQLFTADASATLAPKQTLVMGGWVTKPGKRTLVFIRPEMDGAAAQTGQILLSGRLFEVPDDVLAQVGLDGLKTENTLASAHVILTVEQAQGVVDVLEKTEGVDVLAKPRIQTSNGVQARVSVGETRTSPSGEAYQTGPSLDVTPTFTADADNVRLDVSVRLGLPNPPGR